MVKSPVAERVRTRLRVALIKPIFGNEPLNRVVKSNASHELSVDWRGSDGQKPEKHTACERFGPNGPVKVTRSGRAVKPTVKVRAGD